ALQGTSDPFPPACSSVTVETSPRRASDPVFTRSARESAEFTGFTERIEQDRAVEITSHPELAHGTAAVKAYLEWRRLTVLSTIQRPVRRTLPAVYRWRHPDQPLPLRAVRRPIDRGGRKVGLEAPPWLTTGPADQPFDFCGHVRRLCADVVAKCEELRHVDVSRLLFAVTQARSGVRHGLQARVTPLRFR